MANPDLRMVVLAISPAYGSILADLLEGVIDEVDISPQEEEVCIAVKNEIHDQLGSMPSAEEYREKVSNPDLSPTPAQGAAWDVANKAALIAGKMAKASLEAAEGQTTEVVPGFKVTEVTDEQLAAASPEYREALEKKKGGEDQ